MLNFLTVLAAASLGGGAAILLLTALSPLLARRFSPKVRRIAWRVLAWALFFVPGCFYLFLQITAPLPHAVILTTPRVLVESEYRPMDTYRADNEYAQTHYNSGGAGISGSRHYLHFRGNDGRKLDIEDNYFQRTVIENGVETRTVHWTTLVFLGWLLGAAAHAGAVWGGYLRFRRRALRWAVPAGEGDLDALARQRAAVGCPKTPALYRCPLIRTPLLMGIWRPVILLPEDLPEDALGPALAHELTHLREEHLSDKGALLLARTVHWFNPLVWWMVRRAGQDLELCCDYALTQGRDEAARRAYGQAILNQMTAGKREGVSLTTGFSGSKEEVFRRFRAIMDRSPKGRGRATAVLLACVVLLSQTLVSCQSGRTSGPNVPNGPTSDGMQENTQSGPNGELLVLGVIDKDMTSVIGKPGNWFDGSSSLIELDNEWQVEEQSYPLAESAELLYYPEEDSDAVSTLNPVDIEYSIRQSQAGRLMELTFNGAGEVVRLVLRGGTGGYPPFTGWPELTLYRDDCPYPLGIGGPDFADYVARYVLNAKPQIESHMDWEPVYSEGSYWSTLSWEGLRAVCYYDGDNMTYSAKLIDTTRTDLATCRGIRVGDSREKVLAAYPELEDVTGPDGTVSLWGLEDLEGADALWYNVTGYDYAPEALLFFFKGDALSRIVVHYTFD